MSHLISPAALARELDEVNEVGEVDEIVVVDVRWTLSVGRDPADGPVGRAAYDEGHVPGACFVDLDSELASPAGEGGRHPLPDPTVVQATLRRCGVGERSRVVVYDGRESYAAARAWWVFRWVGVTDVRVLDGGYAAWVAAGLPVSTEVPEPQFGDVTVRPGRMPTLDAAGAATWAREELLLDARTPERYAGEAEPIDPVAGHIPGAVNSPAGSWLTPEGTFRPDVADRWADVRAGRDGQVAVYCGSGVTAAHHVLALAELGVDAALFPGSWSEWIVDPWRPVATGRAPG